MLDFVGWHLLNCTAYVTSFILLCIGFEIVNCIQNGDKITRLSATNQLQDKNQCLLPFVNKSTWNIIWFAGTHVNLCFICIFRWFILMDAIISGRCLLIQLNMKIKTVNLILLMVLFGPLRAIVEWNRQQYWPIRSRLSCHVTFKLLVNNSSQAVLTPNNSVNWSCTAYTNKNWR